MRAFLTNAAEQKEKVMIYYIDEDNNVTQRIIRIMQVNGTKILAYCYYRKQVRSFKLENILSCGPMRRSVGA